MYPMHTSMSQVRHGRSAHTGLARIGSPSAASAHPGQRLDACRAAAACAAGTVRMLREQRAGAAGAPAASHRDLPAHQPASRAHSGVVALLSAGARPAGSSPAPDLAAGKGCSAGAAAAAGVLACLPYELPALRAAPLDTDPAAPGTSRARAGPAASGAPARFALPLGVWAGRASSLASGKHILLRWQASGLSMVCQVCIIFAATISTLPVTSGAHLHKASTHAGGCCHTIMHALLLTVLRCNQWRLLIGHVLEAQTWPTGVPAEWLCEAALPAGRS